MAIVGGLRARLIRESIFEYVNDCLNNLDWFNTSRKHRPVTFRSARVNENEEVPLNTAALSDEDFYDNYEELGSTLTENTQVMYVDFYGEDDAVALHFIRDVRDILTGRMPSVGAEKPHIDVYDYTQATPPVIFSVEIDDVSIDRARGFTGAWQKHWFACRFMVIDHYTDENDS